MFHYRILGLALHSQRMRSVEFCVNTNGRKCTVFKSGKHGTHCITLVSIESKLVRSRDRHRKRSTESPTADILKEGHVTGDRSATSAFKIRCSNFPLAS